MMATIHISDALFKLLEQQARDLGESTDQLVEELLTPAPPQGKVYTDLDEFFTDLDKEADADAHV